MCLHADGLVKLREEYLSADSATRKLLEKRYGKVTIQQALEESFSNEWLKQNSKQCPGCGAFIQVRICETYYNNLTLASGKDR